MGGKKNDQVVKQLHLPLEEEQRNLPPNCEPQYCNDGVWAGMALCHRYDCYVLRIAGPHECPYRRGGDHEQELNDFDEYAWRTAWCASDYHSGPRGR